MRGVQGPTEQRLVEAAVVKELREREHLTFAEIASRLGFRSYRKAQELYTDPDGSRARARKDSYAQPCPSCGQPMSGSNGRANAPMLCSDCTPPPPKVWTQERIIAALREFHGEFRRTPSVTDWLGRFESTNKRLSPERRAEVEAAQGFEFPHPAVVQREFGSWKAAVAAAGLAPLGTGGQAHRSHRFGFRQQQVVDLLKQGPHTLAQIYEKTGMSEAGASVCLGRLMQLGVVERPSRAVYVLSESPSRERKIMARHFVVFERQSDVWEQRAVVEAATATHAIEQVATAEGEYAAVPSNYWTAMKVGTVTKLAVLPAAA